MRNISTSNKHKYKYLIVTGGTVPQWLADATVSPGSPASSYILKTCM